MASSPLTAAGIDQKLRDDFGRRLKDFGIAVDAADPVLAVLFRTFARQLETLYAETDGIRLSLLDELINGLGIANRVARPAQTILRFGLDRKTQFLAAGTALAGEAESGEKVVFATDADIVVSNARIAMVATYQNGSLRLQGGIDMPDDVRSARASLDPVAADLGGCPAIFLAIESLPDSHLSRHSLFCEINSEAIGIARALHNESWCIASPDGVFEAKGILRPRRANAGVKVLEWLVRDRPPDDGSTPGELEAPALPDGFYSGKCFVFPEVPPGKRFLCRCPRAMEPAFSRMFGSPQSFLSKERAWIRISMPSGIGNLHTALTSISLHAISASNVECFNQTIYFDKHGASVPVSKQAGTSSYLVAPLSIFGEGGSEYLPEFQPSFDAGAGRYSLQNGRIILTPARSLDDRLDTYANLRLWVTTGAFANNVGAGKVQFFIKPSASGMPISNLTAAAGGTNEEGYREARARFSDAVLSRDRLVTRTDLITALRAFDRRVRGAELAAGLYRGVHGLQRVQRVTLHLNRGDFIDPSEESRVLTEEVKSYLGQRFLYDMELAVDVEWK
jgi:hypothetical protein